jgi:hypothetical protein
MNIRRISLSLLISFGAVLPLVHSAENWAPIEAKALEQPAGLFLQNPSIPWPSLGWQSTFRLGDRMAVWDEQPIRYITLTAPGVDLQVPFAALEYWSRSAKPSGRYGYELSFKYDNRAILGVSGLNREKFLPTLDDQHWEGYLGSLGRNPAARLINNGDSATNPNQLKILDGRTRVLEFRYRGKEKTDPERAVLQIFTENGDGPYLVFTLECFASDMSFVGPAFSNLVTSFEHGEE